MQIWQALVLGIIQGITEFFPISSSGHLVLVPLVFGWTSQPLVFDTVLHVGTAFAILVYFFQDVVDILTAFSNDLSKHKHSLRKFSPLGKMAIFIFAGSIPAGLIGLAFDNYIEANTRGILPVVLALVIGSLIMFMAEHYGKMSAQVLNLEKSIIIGLFQALALFPGISRSGATISGGMLFGLAREEAARFSFLLGLPIMFVAAGFKVIDSWELLAFSMPLLVGFATSFLVGILSIHYLLGFLRKHGLWSFIIYRLVLALVLMGFLFNS